MYPYVIKVFLDTTINFFHSTVLVAIQKNSQQEQISAAARNYITAVLNFNVGSSEPAMVNDLSQRWKNINVESTWEVIDQREVINGVKQNCRHNAKYI